MAEAKKTGLGSPNMSQADKNKIHKMGGEAQSKEAKAKGGHIGGAKSRRN